MLTSWLGQMIERAWLLMCTELRRSFQTSGYQLYSRMTMSVAVVHSLKGSHLLAGQQLAVMSAEVCNTRQDCGEHRSAYANPADVRQPSEVCTGASVTIEELSLRWVTSGLRLKACTMRFCM